MEPLTPRQSAAMERALSFDVYIKDQKTDDVMPPSRPSHTGNLDYINFISPPNPRYYPIDGGYSRYLPEPPNIKMLLEEACKKLSDSVIKRSMDTDVERHMAKKPRV
jgi:hypothetical protein